jgi:hypothetical protein
MNIYIEIKQKNHFWSIPTYILSHPQGSDSQN